MRRPSLNSCSQSAHTTHTFQTPLVLLVWFFSCAHFFTLLSLVGGLFIHITLSLLMLHNRGMMGPLSKKKTEICELGPNSFFLPFLHFSPRANTARLYLCLPAFFSPHWCSWEKNKKHKKDRVSIFFMCVLFALGRKKSASEWVKKWVGGCRRRRHKVLWNCSPERRELSFMH